MIQEHSLPLSPGFSSDHRSWAMELKARKWGCGLQRPSGDILKVRCLEGPDSLSAPILAQLPLRGFAGRWISRLSACGWRSPRQSASCKTGPSIPRAPRVWEQVTAQNGPRFCRNPAPLSGGSQRQGVACRFFSGRGEEACHPSAYHSELPSSAT